jgi:sarcosine oxidase, subunit gamma
MSKTNMSQTNMSDTSMSDARISPIRRTPSDDMIALWPASASPNLAVRALPPETRLVLRVREADLARNPVAAGLNLAVPINTWTATDGCMAARLGPDEWLITALAESAADLALRLAADLGPRRHALVDVSHRQVAFALSGHKMPALLNAGCALDLHVSRFPTGAATRTLFGKAEIILYRTSDAGNFRLECWRSFAPYIHAFLVEAAHHLD